MPPELLIKSRRLLSEGQCAPGGVLIKDGTIKELVPYNYAPPAGASEYDAGEAVVMPGLVDSHVHVNEPGRTDWEGFTTATQAAAAGGVTTIVDMPLNCIPVTTTAEALKIKLEAAAGKLWVDAGFWGGVVPGNAAELEPMVRAGALGFKAFMIHSGIDEFPNASETDLRKAMAVLAPLNVALLLHAELDCTRPALDGQPRDYGRYLHSRPEAWEEAAIALAARLCAETGCRTHIVHLSAASAVPLLAAARRAGAPLTAETCPHYLTFASEEIAPGRTEFKCSPPIRERANREALWRALPEGALSLVASDHSPCLPQLKRLETGDFEAAWGGVSGLQFTLPAVWTGMKARGLGLEMLPRWVCEGPARLAGLPRKGRLEPGADADLVAWDPEAEFEVRPEHIRHRHRVTPYSGRRLYGAVRAVFLRGETIFEEGKIGAGPRGRALLREATA